MEALVKRGSDVRWRRATGWRGEDTECSRAEQGGGWLPQPSVKWITDNSTIFW